MAAVRSFMEKVSEVTPDSPSTLVATHASDCEAVVDQSGPQKVEECPEGYPRLAAFLSSEHNFSIYRGFTYLHARVLLGLQDQIAALERELDKKDQLDTNNGFGDRLYSRARDEIEDTDTRSRLKILNDIRSKLGEYDDFLVKARDMVSFHKPSGRDYGSKLFVAPELRDKTLDKNMHYYTRSRVDKLIGLIITTIVFVLLILPVVAMYQLRAIKQTPQSTFSAVGVLIVFTLLFSATMSFVTKAQRHELFASSAAYCAVLVVFISNFGNLS
ncbi:MAG: hypothetical protein Q9187_002037 [Circinaria calcarea]